MGGAVSNFIGNVAKTVAKGVTSWVGDKIPIIGTPLANAVNGLYKKGGKMVKGYAEGGMVNGREEVPINTKAQLLSLVKKFPEQAAAAGLSVDLIKEKAMEIAGVPKRRGGKREHESSMGEKYVMGEKYALGGVAPNGAYMMDSKYAEPYAKGGKKVHHKEHNHEEHEENIHPHHSMGGLHHHVDPLGHLDRLHKHFNQHPKRHHVYAHPDNSIF